MPDLATYYANSLSEQYARLLSRVDYTPLEPRSRVAAIATDSLPLPSGPWPQVDAMLGHKLGCTYCAIIGRPHREAAAKWVRRNGSVYFLCKSCLDIWLDDADDNPDLEPASWAWLTTDHQ
ncbi:hypothetical protein D7231_31890 [Streptomyces klenkii]|uniref:Uncharacterized protein n=1 Tax=Streptomyces klenkii TaxID=1420899 RepID=A0A3B0ARB1_9ACTN|nr:hypothetical protein [Streptomyces klenkii]RKN61876.1 hypothetical protein D7231_31890 [Streptomyces klenkii]